MKDLSSTAYRIYERFFVETQNDKEKIGLSINVTLFTIHSFSILMSIMIYDKGIGFAYKCYPQF